jgi:hypothetical protein
MNAGSHVRDAEWTAPVNGLVSFKINAATPSGPHQSSKRYKKQKKEIRWKLSVRKFFEN